MGNARVRSWSFSRQEAFNRCKRSFFYQYFWYGEPDADILWALRRVQTMPMFVGDLAHEMISLGLRQFMSSGIEAKDLNAIASDIFNRGMKSSLSAAVSTRSGRKPMGKGAILSHHLDTGERSAVDDVGLATTIGYLEEFQRSEAWKFLRKTYRQSWLPITTSSDDLPHFTASTKEGFRKAIGLRIYTPFDLALSVGGDFILVDWKTGSKSDAAQIKVRRQLASYCLWALSNDKLRRTLRVQPFFLQPEERWDPTPVTNSELDEVIYNVEAHDYAERMLITPRADKYGTIVSYDANKEDFPTSPSKAICAGCRFRTVCEDGKKALAV